MIYFELIYVYRARQRFISPPWLVLSTGRGCRSLYIKHTIVNFSLIQQGRTSLVVQWLRILLPAQGTRVQALVQEDPTCCRATKSVCHNYWACALEPVSHNYWSPHAYSPCSTTREATAMRSLRTTTKSSPHSLQLVKAHVQQWRPNAAKNKIK